MKSILLTLTITLLTICRPSAAADKLPDREALFRIAYEGLKEKPNAWMPLVSGRIIRVIEIRIPASPQTRIRPDERLCFVCELEVQELWSDSKRLEHQQARFEVEARRDGEKWRLIQAIRRGDWEPLTTLRLTVDEIEKLPTLETASLDALYGKPYEPSAAETPATVNPLETHLGRLMAVTRDNGSSPAGASVEKALSLLADYIKIFASRPDWARLQRVQRELATVFDATNTAFASDPRSAELKGVWSDIATSADQIFQTELAAYRDRKSKQRSNLERAVVEILRARNSGTSNRQPKKLLEKLQPHVDELAYVIALAPAWANINWKPDQPQSSAVTLGGTLALGQELMQSARSQYEQECAAAIDRELQKLRQLYDGGYLDGVAALEKARNLPEKTPNEASVRYAKYETALSSFSAMLRRMRHAAELYSPIADRELAGTRIAALIPRVVQQRAEAQDGMDRLAIRVRADAKAAYEAWVKNLSGDKKRIFDSVGRPGEAKGDIWYYRSTRAGNWTTTIYTFRGDRLIGNRSVPWYE